MKKKLLARIHNVFLALTVAVAFAIYIFAICSIDSLGSTTALKLVIPSLTYMIFMLEVNMDKPGVINE